MRKFVFRRKKILRTQIIIVHMQYHVCTVYWSSSIVHLTLTCIPFRAKFCSSFYSTCCDYMHATNIGSNNHFHLKIFLLMVAIPGRKKTARFFLNIFCSCILKKVPAISLKNNVLGYVFYFTKQDNFQLSHTGM